MANEPNGFIDERHNNALTGSEAIDHASIAMAEAAKARVQSAYIMALKNKRNEDNARIDILNACKRPQFAERVEYSKPVGKKSIRGPSVRLAETALRCWGNIITETFVIFENNDIKRVKIICTDLENNASHSKEISIKKTVERRNPPEDREVIGTRTNTQGKAVYIVKATEDELHNKEAALVSKALRNEGLRLIPTDIIDEAMQTARETLRRKDSEDPQAAKKRILDAFATINIKPNDLEKYLGHKTDTISPVELENLRGVYQAISEGSATWGDYVQEGEKKESAKDAGAGELKDKLKKNLKRGGGEKCSKEQVKKIGDLVATTKGWDMTRLNAVLKQYGVKMIPDLTIDSADQIIVMIKEG